MSSNAPVLIIAAGCLLVFLASCGAFAFVERPSLVRVFRALAVVSGLALLAMLGVVSVLGQ